MVQDLSRGARAGAGGEPAQPRARRAQRHDRPRRGRRRARSTPPGRMSGVDAVVVAVGAGGDGGHRRRRPRRGRACGRDRRPARRFAATLDRGRVRLRPRCGRAPSAIRAGLAVPLAAPGRAPRLSLGVLPLRAGTPSARREPRSSRSSPSGPGRRSTTPAASARRASSPTSTRSPACTTAATSTRRSRREVARAHRYGRSLALVVFDLDDFKAINDRIGHLAGDGVLAEAADRVRDVVRSADVACRVGGDEFAVILPESSFKDADQLYARLEQALSVRPIGQAGRLHLSAGVTDCAPTTTRSRSSSGRTRRSIAPRAPARERSSPSTRSCACRGRREATTEGRRRRRPSVGSTPLRRAESRPREPRSPRRRRASWSRPHCRFQCWAGRRT